MKAVATGFLLGATLIFALSRWLEVSAGLAWAGYVRAAAEAGMVGALADWFAVTALFRRPLGLPIPHTAIIPTRKDVLGSSLSDFVGANFLAENVVRDKLRRAGIARRIGSWLTDPDHAERVTSELATAARGAVSVLRDDEVAAVVEHAIVHRLTERQWGPPMGKLLGQILADGSHHKLVDLLVDQGFEWVRDNQETVARMVTQKSPSWSPKFVDEMVAERVYNEALAFAWAVKTDPEHPARITLDKFLIGFASDLQSDPATMAKAEQLKHQVLAHPDVQRVVASAWGTAKTMLLDAAEDPSSELRLRVRNGVMSLGKRLTDDPAVRDKADETLENAAAHVVVNYREEITTLITDTVERWDAQETSRKVELQVGRDLQFIRINGTVVGALAGLLIYTVAQFVF